MIFSCSCTFSLNTHVVFICYHARHTVLGTVWPNGKQLEGYQKTKKIQCAKAYTDLHIHFISPNWECDS